MTPREGKEIVKRLTIRHKEKLPYADAPGPMKSISLRFISKLCILYIEELGNNGIIALRII